MANPVPMTFRPIQVDSDSEDKQLLVRPVCVPPDVVEALEHDLCEGCRDPATTQLSSTVFTSVVQPQSRPVRSVMFGLGSTVSSLHCWTR